MFPLLRLGFCAWIIVMDTWLVFGRSPHAFIGTWSKETGSFGLVHASGKLWANKQPMVPTISTGSNGHRFFSTDLTLVLTSWASWQMVTLRSSKMVVSTCWMVSSSMAAVIAWEWEPSQPMWGLAHDCNAWLPYTKRYLDHKNLLSHWLSPMVFGLSSTGTWWPHSVQLALLHPRTCKRKAIWHSELKITTWLII